MVIYDREKVLVAMRSFRHRDMDAAYMVDLMREVDKLASSCKVPEPTKPHKRGSFAQMLIGWNHGMGEGDNVSAPTKYSVYTMESSRLNDLSIRIVYPGIVSFRHKSTTS